MSLSSTALQQLSEHWAVGAIGATELARAERLVNERLARQAVGRQIDLSAYPRGVFILIFTLKEKTITKRLIKL